MDGVGFEVKLAELWEQTYRPIGTSKRPRVRLLLVADVGIKLVDSKMGAVSMRLWGLEDISAPETIDKGLHGQDHDAIVSFARFGLKTDHKARPKLRMIHSDLT